MKINFTYFLKFAQIFIFVFALIVYFNSTLRNPLEYDLGWQLRVGEYVLNHHAIPRENIFSYEMASYHWVASDWGLDVIRYLLYVHFGFFGFTIIQAIVATVTLLLFSKAFHLSFWEISILSILIYYVLSPINDNGFTGTSVSFLGLALLYYILDKFISGKRRFLYLTIPLFLLWPNLHGEFFLGFAIFGLWSILYIISKSINNGNISFPQIINELKFLLPILLLTFAATLINPYGIEIYTKSALLLNGNPMQKVITEWFPFKTYSVDWWTLAAWGVLIFINICIFMYKKELLQRLPYILPVLVLLVMAFFMRRYAWPMYLLSIPVVYPIISQLQPKMKWLSLLVSFVLLSGFYLYVSFSLLPQQYVFAMDWNVYCSNSSKCSLTTAQFFSDYVTNHHIPPSKYLTPYDYGGFLIWNFPQITPTIDGRMPLWVDDHGYSAFEKYYAYERTWTDINNSPYDVIYISKGKPLYTRLVELVSQKKWRLLTEDSTSALFERIEGVP